LNVSTDIHTGMVAYRVLLVLGTLKFDTLRFYFVPDLCNPKLFLPKWLPVCLTEVTAALKFGSDLAIQEATEDPTEPGNRHSSEIT
jgi:hypothetical protein